MQKKLWDNAMRVYSQILHKCARNRDNHKVASLLKLSEITTKCDAVKWKKSEESITFLAKKYGVSRPTIYKWKSADNLKDKPSIRHKLPTVLTELEEQIICTFRRTTQLTLDDCFIALNTDRLWQPALAEITSLWASSQQSGLGQICIVVWLEMG